MDEFKIITVILSIGTAVGPIIFGFAVWKLSGIYVTRERFEDWRKNAEEERLEIKKRLADIERHIWRQ